MIAKHNAQKVVRQVAALLKEELLVAIQAVTQVVEAILVMVMEKVKAEAEAFSAKIYTCHF